MNPLDVVSVDLTPNMMVLPQYAYVHASQLPIKRSNGSFRQLRTSSLQMTFVAGWTAHRLSGRTYQVSSTHPRIQNHLNHTLQMLLNSADLQTPIDGNMSITVPMVRSSFAFKERD